MKTNVAIIGSGIAGLTFAIQLAEQNYSLKITVFAKSSLSNSNTNYAQGGIATVSNFTNDSIANHIHDTLKAGDGECDPTVVEFVISKANSSLEHLIRWGAQFDTDNHGNFDLGLEGGHSKNRIIHFKDKTGEHIQDILIRKAQAFPTIEFIENCFVSSISPQDNGVSLCVVNGIQNKFQSIESDYVVLCTGGVGQIYSTTTNPEVATGDGIAMAHDCGLTITGMEFIQFHPTVFFQKERINSQAFLISEAVRGKGAHLVNNRGVRFMHEYDERLELSPRDIVSRAIHKEITREKTPYVFLDLRHLNPKEFKQEFPGIYNHLSEHSINISKDLIPIRPAAHYLCGGIQVDTKGQTSHPRIFSIGECASTGLHGANRLASNSLLEALVFGIESANYLSKARYRKRSSEKSLRHELSNSTLQSSEPLLKSICQKIQELTDNHLGIIRTQKALIACKEGLLQLQSHLFSLSEKYQYHSQYYEVKNRINVAMLITEHSILRNENKGGFFKDN